MKLFTRNGKQVVISAATAKGRAAWVFLVQHRMALSRRQRQLRVLPSSQHQAVARHKLRSPRHRPLSPLLVLHASTQLRAQVEASAAVANVRAETDQIGILANSRLVHNSFS